MISPTALTVDTEPDGALPASEEGRQWLRSLLLAAANLYNVALILLLALHALAGDVLWPVAFLSNFTHWLLLPTFPVLVLMLWRRHWRSGALAAVNAAAFLWLFGGLLVPKASVGCASPPDGCLTLRVMTYNTRTYMADASLPVLVETLRHSNADIIALQEVSPRHAAALEQGLRDVYPYRVFYSDYLLPPGMALLSRYPIVEYALFRLETPAPQMRATLDVHGQPLEVINAHPPPPRFRRAPQMYDTWGIADIPPLVEMATTGKPTILLGDFNATDQSDAYAILSEAGLTDAFRVSGWGLGPTFPAGYRWRAPVPPLVRIDYIWYTGQFDATRAWVGPDAGSDHLPVLAELVWRFEEPHIGESLR